MGHSVVPAPPGRARRDRRPGARFGVPSDAALRCLWIKLGDQLMLSGFESVRAPADLDVPDRLAPVDVWVRRGHRNDQVWLWGTGLIELTVAGHHCHVAYVESVGTGDTADSASVIAETAATFVRLCDCG